MHSELSFNNFCSDIKDMPDLHIFRFYSTFVTVSDGRVIKVSNPLMSYCPLADILYPNLRNVQTIQNYDIREEIKKSVEGEIKDFGLFTDRRQLYSDNISIRFGASEISMFALRKKTADAVVMACDGAGTVIVPVPEVAQGIGMRMNGLFRTSTIAKTIKRLKDAGCFVPFSDAKIDQETGAAHAAEIGYKKIIVTISGFCGGDFKKVRDAEKKYDISVTIMSVCNTGVSVERINEINRYADIVWSCGSDEIRNITGKKALAQLSKAIPVFIMTKKGLLTASAYFEDENIFKDVSFKRQCLVCDDCKGRDVRAGDFTTRTTYTVLPVLGRKNPVMC